MSFIKTWDETVPSGSRAINLGDNDIREFKYAIRERLAEEHNFKASEGSDADIGRHNKVTLIASGTDLAGVSGTIRLFSKTVSGVIELFAVLADSTVIQLTSSGKLNGASLTALASIPSAAGIIPIANLASGTPDGTQYIRDDGTLADPAVEAASDAEVKTGSEAGKYVAPSTMIGHEGVVKGWINFKGDGTAINDSYNVSGIVDDGTGLFTITWNTDFGSANYAAVGMTSSSITLGFMSIAAGSVQVRCQNYNGVVVDTTTVCVIAIGDR